MNQYNDNVARFDSVDQAVHPDFFTRFLDKSLSLRNIGIYKQMMIDLLAIKEGATLLDVGCGTGQDALAMPSIEVVCVQTRAGFQFMFSSS